jgi:hypothetical protein
MSAAHEADRWYAGHGWARALLSAVLGASAMAALAMPDLDRDFAVPVVIVILLAFLFLPAIAALVAAAPEFAPYTYAWNALAAWLAALVMLIPTHDARHSESAEISWIVEVLAYGTIWLAGCVLVGLAIFAFQGYREGREST